MFGRRAQTRRAGGDRHPRSPVAIVAAACALAFSGTVRGAERVDFSRDIQPLLAKRCFSCHGPETREGGLRLDEQAGATLRLESGGHAIVPGKVAESAILARITSADPDVQMPPEGPRLTAAQVDALRRWIEEGAEWREHWAFRPLVRPPVPAAAPVDGQTPNPIDAFIRDQLARRDLPPPAAAEKIALLRRVTYDLTGLPPTEQEVREFVADPSPRAWETVVDRLLASPRYGEQWARHWLDLVRYADTNSFERDANKPHAWRYRDYVIRSLNDDKPYDRFVIEQLAGDELPDGSADSLIATGYYRLGIWDDEPADKLQSRYDWLDDIVATTGQTFLGLTVNCARCHDHKIDPLTQRDYYGLLAFFHAITPMANGGPQIVRPIFATDADRRRHDAAVVDLDRRRTQAQQAVTAIETRFEELWAAEAGGSPAAVDLDDLSFRFYRDSWASLPNFDDLKPEDVGSLPGNLFDIEAAPSLRPDQFGYVFTGFLKVPQAGDYTFTLDSDDGARLTIGGDTVIEYDGVHGLGVPRTATVTLAAGRLPIRLDYFQGLHGRGLSVMWSGPGFSGRSLSALDAAGRKARAMPTAAELIRTEGERLLGPDGKKRYDDAVAALNILKAEQVPVDEALVVTESGTAAPPTHVFYRGNPHSEPKPETLVHPSFPSIFATASPVFTIPAGGGTTGRRTALARWIASPENPLTARVVTNRIWQYHFGRGIVRSASNFGMMGDPPTHPELLDWLASELIANNWRWKPIHRLILLSRAYQATSRADAGSRARDPLNDSFWRFDMRRLTAEELRDSIHVAAGVFNPKMYGPGVYPDIPREVMAGQSRPGHGWGRSRPEEQARRSLYIHVKRSLITPLLTEFDVADPDATCPVRFVTTQPTQALGMMNGDFLQQQARAFAERVRREAGGPDAADVPSQVRRALSIALTRPASDEEVARGVAVIAKLEDADGIDPRRAMELFCLMVLNLNEFAYLD